METETQILAVWLLDRIAEDEREATVYRDQWVDGGGVTRSGSRGWERLLAQCAAHRHIVELHALSSEERYVHNPDGPDYAELEWSCATCEWVPPGSGCDTLRALATIYADHEGYRAEWR